MGNLLSVLKDQNATADALRARFKVSQDMELDHVIPFSSDRKYSGAAFKDTGTYLMGAVQFLFRKEIPSWQNIVVVLRKRDFVFWLLLTVRM